MSIISIYIYLYSHKLGRQTQLISGMERSQSGSRVRQHIKTKFFFVDKRCESDTKVHQRRGPKYTQNHFMDGDVSLQLYTICTFHPPLAGVTGRFRAGPPSDSFSAEGAEGAGREI